MDPIRSQVSPDRFFAGLTEYVFETRLGFADPPLVDYVSGLLGRFILAVEDEIAGRLEGERLALKRFDRFG